MTRYHWMIRTGDQEMDGPLGEVYLSLHGLRATTGELKIPRRAYARATVVSGMIEVEEDLGELQTGTLRTDAAERSPWTLDWVKVVNLADGRQWTAPGGSCAPDGTCDLLQFDRTSAALALQKIDTVTAEEESERPPEADTSEAPAPIQASRAAMRTYELFATLRGATVPLSHVLRIRAGLKKLTPGAQIFVTGRESQGFGLGGEPGLWEDLYPGTDPAMYGLDTDKPVLASDGSQGWVVDAHYLAMIFGAGWRRVVYGT